MASHTSNQSSLYKTGGVKDYLNSLDDNELSSLLREHCERLAGPDLVTPWPSPFSIDRNSVIALLCEIMQLSEDNYD